MVIQPANLQAQSSSAWLGPDPTALQQDYKTLIPIYQAAYDCGKWLPFPQDKSLHFYQSSLLKKNGEYNANQRNYILDFESMEQTNTVSEGRRSLRLA